MTSPDFEKLIPQGDDKLRDVCKTCGFIDYKNPKIVGGAVVTFGDKILLCRRAIEPRYGYWTLPAGFMEIGETVEEGAAREALEEAEAKIIIDRLLGVYSIPRIGQVHMMYLAHMEDGHIAAGLESLDVKFVTFDEIPWKEMAFPTGVWALKDYAKIKGQKDFAPFTNPPEADAMVR